MALDIALAQRLIDSLNEDLDKDRGRIGLVRRYLAGDHDKPYCPKGARREFQLIADQSVDNWLPLVSDTFTKGLFVDGHRGPKSKSNSKAWEHWQANGMDARQTITTRGAIDYGVSYVLVLPGRPNPVIRPIPGTKAIAFYKDDNDEFPKYLVRDRGVAMDPKVHLYEVVDDENVYTLAMRENAPLVCSKTEAHSMGVCPAVRFRDRLDGEAVGLIRPLIPLQNRINEIVFTTMIALQYASFRQRWATGLAIPRDDDGKPVDTFQSAINRVWVSDKDSARFGDFAQTDISGHIRLYDETIKTLAGLSQISPNIMTGDLNNLGAEALAQLDQSTQRKLDQLEIIFGEAWESVLRLACLADGDKVGAKDTETQVRWRDSAARGFVTTITGLATLAKDLKVPVEALWERIPDTTDTDIERWKQLRDAQSTLDKVVEQIGAELAPPSPLTAPPPAPPAMPAAGAIGPMKQPPPALV